MTSRPGTLPPLTDSPPAGAFSQQDLNHITDIAGKRLEGADLTGLGAGQAQWREMVARNLSFWNLPSVVIFNHNQNGIAVDVATGYVSTPPGAQPPSGAGRPLGVSPGAVAGTAFVTAAGSSEPVYLVSGVPQTSTG